MRVLHVVPSFYPARHFGGPIVSVYELCNHLARRADVDLRVLTSDTSGPHSADRLLPDERNDTQYSGYAVTFCRKILGTAIAPGIVARIWLQVAWADVVHLTGVYSFPTLPTLLAARLLKRPIVWSPRGSLQVWAGTRRLRLKGIWQPLCRVLLVHKRTVLHMTSPEEVERSAKAIPGFRSTVIPNGVEIPDEPSERQWLPGGTLRLIFLGRLDPIKGIENLLESISILRTMDLRLSLYGKGDTQYERSLRQAAIRLGILDRVQFCGMVTGIAKVRALQDADICVVPSHSENFGIVVGEALAHGTPVIASTGTPWRELAVRGAGRWIPNDPQSLAAAIESMRNEKLSEMGRRGREWMEREYRWEAIAARTFELYLELATGSRG